MLRNHALASAATFVISGESTRQEAVTPFFPHCDRFVRLVECPLELGGA